jgi:hypothetical protein
MIVRNVTTADNIESRIVLCKALTSTKIFFGHREFTRKALLYIIKKTVRLRKPSYSQAKYISEPITSEQASSMFNIMLSKGYIEFSRYYKPKPDKRLPIPIGEKLYRIGQSRLDECEETTWYKNRERKERFLKKEGAISTRSCKALQQIYTMFGNMPFSYKTVIYASNAVLNLTTEQKSNLTDAEKKAFAHMKAKLYSYDINSFRQVWQSLVKNGYILPHRIKTADGYIKKTGLYRINQPYLKLCIAETS